MIERHELNTSKPIQFCGKFTGFQDLTHEHVLLQLRAVIGWQFSFPNSKHLTAACWDFLGGNFLQNAGN
jgi:hypothetical protein